FRFFLKWVFVSFWYIPRQCALRFELGSFPNGFLFDCRLVLSVLIGIFLFSSKIFDACACCRLFFLRIFFWVLFIFSLLPFLFAIYVSFSFILIFLLSSCSRLDHCPHI
ncbi:LOW QUALITY PROTEIN: hypothetical protein PanWU01x14_283860, partial [Parasponia andersonii]